LSRSGKDWDSWLYDLGTPGSAALAEVQRHPQVKFDQAGPRGMMWDNVVGSGSLMLNAPMRVEDKAQLINDFIQKMQRKR
jgi:hypothetical protein